MIADLLRGRVAPAMLGVVLAAFVAGCGAGPQVTAAHPGATSSSSTTPGPEEPSPTAKASRPPDPVLSAPPLVQRAGALPLKSRATAKAAPFTGALRYPDGLAVTVTKVTQGESTGNGPGVFVGAPRTQLTITVRNGSAKAVDLSRVVVTTTYGKPPRLAQPVYDDGARDLSGMLAVGAQATGTYQFSIPTNALGAVTTYVDVDGTRAPGVLSGSVE